MTAAATSATLVAAAPVSTAFAEPAVHRGAPPPFLGGGHGWFRQAFPRAGAVVPPLVGSIGVSPAALPSVADLEGIRLPRSVLHALRDALGWGESSPSSPTQSGLPRGSIPQSPRNSGRASEIRPVPLQDVMRGSSPPAREERGSLSRSSQALQSISGEEISPSRGRCRRGCVACRLCRPTKTSLCSNFSTFDTRLAGTIILFLKHVYFCFLLVLFAHRYNTC